MKFLNLRILLMSSLLLASIAQATEQQELSVWLNNVVKQHPRLQAAQAVVDKAEAIRRAADQPIFNPEIELEYERADVDTKTAGITQTIDWGDKRSAQTSIAELRWRLSLIELEFQQQQLSVDALLALTRYQSAVHSAQISNKRKNSMNEFSSIANRRYKAGDLMQVDLLLARLSTSEATFQQVDAQSELVASEQALYVLLGEVSQRLLASLPIINATPDFADDTTKITNDVIDTLPQMKLARTKMDIARAEIQLRQREQRPNPTIGIKAGKEGDESLTNVTFSMPLFVRNNFSAKVDAANAELIQRQREAIDTRRLSMAKLTAAKQTLQLNRKAWAQWQVVGQKSLAQQETLLERLWQAGELSTADYLVQLKQSLDTQASAMVHRTQFWVSWAQWLIASGEINKWVTHSNSAMETGHE